MSSLTRPPPDEPQREVMIHYCCHSGTETSKPEHECSSSLSVCCNHLLFLRAHSARYSRYAPTSTKVEIHPFLPLEPATAITVHKSQGRTLGKVTLALSHKRGMICNMEYVSVYVAFSRVRKKEAIFFLLPELTLTYVLSGFGAGCVDPGVFRRIRGKSVAME
jgi:hypothetical protein